jgi:hypothetical protein
MPFDEIPEVSLDSSEACRSLSSPWASRLALAVTLRDRSFPVASIGSIAFKQTMAAPKATFPDMVRTDESGQSIDFEGITMNNMQEVLPRTVNKSSRILRRAALFARLEIPITVKA